jgi:hypothetical protein
LIVDRDGHRLCNSGCHSASMPETHSALHTHHPWQRKSRLKKELFDGDLRPRSRPGKEKY